MVEILQYTRKTWSLRYSESNRGEKEINKLTVASYNNSFEGNKCAMCYQMRLYIRKGGQGKPHEDITLKLRPKERE